MPVLTGLALCCRKNKMEWRKSSYTSAEPSAKRTCTFHADGNDTRRPCASECPHCSRKEKQETAAVAASASEAIARESDPELTQWIDKWTTQDLRQQQEKDPDLKQLLSWKESGERPDWEHVKGISSALKLYWALYSEIVLHEGVLYRQLDLSCKPVATHQVLTPVQLRRDLFTFLHHHRTGGHLGIKKTLARLRRRFWWPGQRTDIERWCKYCETCQFRKMSSGSSRSPLQQEIASAPFERIAIDILTFPVATDNGNTCVLVVCDYYTKWTNGYALPDHRASTVADVLVTEVFLQFGTTNVSSL
ncbi:hypothetical protein BaRGS_00014614 [Batillaria attramentaria]|uniref:Integrase zinc-binding domain-containing protein n=1 Tax=Batillaria attramentaria TaxID=370345 RepID=A0ABD0L3P1_9CAEN